jgi:hypothetical protein
MTEVKVIVVDNIVMTVDLAELIGYAPRYFREPSKADLRNYKKANSTKRK